MEINIYYCSKNTPFETRSGNRVIPQTKHVECIIIINNNQQEP